jgi:hypothetical protein
MRRTPGIVLLDADRSAEAIAGEIVACARAEG